MTEPCASYYHRHRFPAEIIAEAVWLYFRCTVSFRMVEDMLAYRGIIVAYKTIREWDEKFGRDYANKIRRHTPRPGDKWHLESCGGYCLKNRKLRELLKITKLTWQHRRK